MLSIAAGTVIAGLIAAAAAAAGSAQNTYMQKKTNEQNANINQQNLDYQTHMTQQAWERDEKAHQKEVADLQAAGLSPLAATGGTNVSAPLGANAPIAMQAPQLDTNSLVQAVMQSAQLGETQRHNKQLEGFKDTELSQQAEQISLAHQKLEIENKKVNADIKHQIDLINLENSQLEETIRSNKSNENLKKSSYISERNYKEIEHQVGAHLPYEAIYDYDYYLIRKKMWNLEYKNWLEKHKEPLQGSQGENSSQSLNGGFGLGVATANGNINAGESTSKGSFKSWNNTEYFKSQELQFYKEHPQPVFLLKD